MIILRLAGEIRELMNRNEDTADDFEAMGWLLHRHEELKREMAQLDMEANGKPGEAAPWSGLNPGLEIAGEG